MECIKDLAQGLVGSPRCWLLIFPLRYKWVNLCHMQVPPEHLTVGEMTVTTDAGCGYWKQPWLFNSLSQASVRGLDHRRPPTVCSCQNRGGCRSEYSGHWAEDSQVLGWRA